MTKHRLNKCKRHALSAFLHIQEIWQPLGLIERLNQELTSTDALKTTMWELCVKQQACHTYICIGTTDLRMRELEEALRQ